MINEPTRLLILNQPEVKFMNKSDIIVNNILEKINLGNLEDGDKLPSQRAMAEQYNVNRSTVVEALEKLKANGIVEAIEKKGVYISHSLSMMVQNHLSWQERIKPNIDKQNQYYIQRINEHEFDLHIIRLGTGELSPMLIPTDQFKAIIGNDLNNEMHASYEEPLGNEKLRLAIQTHALSRGIECSVDEICITSGALQGLKLIAEGTLLPDSKIYLETPSYMQSVKTWRNTQVNMQPISILSLKRKVLLNEKVNINSFLYLNPILHNPTGNTYTIEEMNRIIDDANHLGIPIVEDDIYSETWFDEQPPLPMKSMSKSNNVIYIGSLSKSVSPGLRIGWIIANKHLVKHLADIKMQTDYGASSISQYIATNWLTHYHQEHLLNLRKTLKSRSEKMNDVLHAQFGDVAIWNKPQGSFYIWLKLKVKIDMHKLFEKCLDNQILIHPGEIYDPKQKNAIRLSYSYIDEDLIESTLIKLRKIIDEILENN